MLERLFKTGVGAAIVVALIVFGGYVYLSDLNLFFRGFALAILAGGLAAIVSLWRGTKEGRIEGTSLSRGQLRRLYKKLPDTLPSCFRSWAFWYAVFGMEARTANALGGHITEGLGPREVVDIILKHGSEGLLTPGYKRDGFGEESLKIVLRWLENYYREHVRK